MISDNGGAVLLDLDGTLTDSFPGISRSILHALDRMGAPPLPESELRNWIGPPIHQSFAAHFGGDEDAGVRARTFYRERFASVGIYENSVYPGIPEALAAMHGAGLRLFLATSKARPYAERIVDHFELSPFVEAVHGSELDGTRSDKAEIIAHVLATRNVDPGRAVMVGDRSYDIVGARRNGIGVVGVTWGFRSDGEFASHPPDRIVERTEDLPGAVAEVLRSRR